MNTYNQRRIRVGMIGGGIGSTIGEVHRSAMRLTDRFDLVAGIFSRNHKHSLHTGLQIGIDPNRTYAGIEEMIQLETVRPDGVELVVIVTPNESHFPLAYAAIDAGLHVVCEKPLTASLRDALDLYKKTIASRIVFGLTHNYSGYSMVRQAAAMVREGSLGTVRLVQAEHAQGAGALPVEFTEGIPVPWRSDPEQVGKEIVVADIGTHAHHLIRFITGQEVEEVSADLSTHVKGRKVYDNAQISLRLTNGSRGALWASRVATGNEHGLRIRIFGERAALHWDHEDPEHLRFCPLDKPPLTLSKGQPGLSSAAQATQRLRLGHPEGFIDSFASLYHDFGDAIQDRGDRNSLPDLESIFPTVVDGVYGVTFIESVSRSHKANGAWTETSVSLDK
ncbi:MAG: Gfo/Idh/MocA family oxidoreductase [Desulfobacterales bacterium]|nr:Gfo/Idh/MocA family oxidoreductase [Desulfobacterales bacterium]